MYKFLKKYIDLILAAIWLVVMVLDIITKSYGELLKDFMIVICCLQIFILKSEVK